MRPKPNSAQPKRVFVAPSRDAVDASRFAHPVFDGFRGFDEWLIGPEWPGIADFDQRAAGLHHAFTKKPLRFVEQIPELLADGLHYEQRIHEQGFIATRVGNWHDLFNAMAWLRFPKLKSALNARQWRDVQAVGPKTRTPGQCAMTLFDEAGCVVRMDDAGMRECWRTHDWQGLFVEHADAWRQGRARVWVFGHALLEHALVTETLLVGKCVVLPPSSQIMHAAECFGEDGGAGVVEALAAAIADSTLLTSTQQLRTLPLAGIPGWHAQADSAAFIRSAKCFAPAPKVLRDFV